MREYRHFWRNAHRFGRGDKGNIGNTGNNGNRGNKGNRGYRGYNGNKGISVYCMHGVLFIQYFKVQVDECYI